MISVQLTTFAKMIPVNFGLVIIRKFAAEIYDFKTVFH